MFKNNTSANAMFSQERLTMVTVNRGTISYLVIRESVFTGINN